MKLIKIFLAISIVLNISLIGYIIYGMNYIRSEDFSVIAMSHISETFCKAYEREYKGTEKYEIDDMYRPFCTKKLEYINDK